MNTFDIKAVCKKCGGKSVTAVFVKNATSYDCGFVRYCKLDGNRNFEHIHRTCQLCHHTWNELPLDSTQASREAQ